MHVTTIVARRELPRARTLAESLSRHDPQVKCVVLVLDDDRAGDIGNVEVGSPGSVGSAIETLGPGALEIPGFSQLAARLDHDELREAVKPVLVRHLLARSSGGPVCYLEADSYVTGPLHDIDRAAAEHGVVVWARTPAPLPPDGRRPNEADLRGAGLHDPGLFAVGPGTDQEAVLEWWALRASAGGGPAGGAAPIDRLTTIARRRHELRDPGIGASYWNLYGRSIDEQDGCLMVDGAPLRLLRLAGFDAAHPELLSDVQDRIHLTDHPPLARVCREYAERLLANGEATGRDVAYGWGALPDGTRFDRRLRDIYARAHDEAKLSRSPFTVAGMEEFYAWLAEPAPAGGAFGINRLCWLVREAQPELREAYPRLELADQAHGLIGWLHAYGMEPGTLPPKLMPPPTRAQAIRERQRTAPPPPWGVNVAGYFESESGVGEAARLVVAALDTAEVPLLPVGGRSVPATRHEDPFTSLEVSAAHFPVNLVCVNADGLPEFREDAGEPFFDGRHTIGMWWWELSRFPDRWEPSFGLLDEVWVGTEHVASGVEAASTIPVHRVRLPVVRPRVVGAGRESLGLPEGFLFLHTFDFHSVFERKNPLAVIEAFRAAFPESSGAVLAIRAVNGEADPANHRRLIDAASCHQDIVVLEGYLSRTENHEVTASCDCYVSLHRAEGFGLTLAEAMSLGRPVIATGYSGNLDFMTERNSYLVGHEMVPVGPGSSPYPPEAEWAEPDVGHAARLLREVFENQDGARVRGQVGAREIAVTHSLEAAGRSMARRLESLRLHVPSRNGAGHAFDGHNGGDPVGGIGERIGRRLAGRHLRLLYGRIEDLRLTAAELDLELEDARREGALNQAAALRALRRRDRVP
jgi:glycosyltransferase involved in cell wall biosynthesis